MKKFILGFVCAVIIGILILLVYAGVISLKTAVLVPLCLAFGFCAGMTITCMLFKP